MIARIATIVSLVLLIQNVSSLPNPSGADQSPAEDGSKESLNLLTGNETYSVDAGTEPVDSIIVARTGGGGGGSSSSSGTGLYHWDARKNPESASNTCWWMYCHPHGSDTITFGDGRQDRGKLSGQKASPVSNAESRAKYSLTHIPAQQPKFNRWSSTAKKWQDITGQALDTKVTDEWPPASAEEGGTGASLMATTQTDSNAQGGVMGSFWTNKDKHDKVKIVMTGFDDRGLDARSKAILHYCACKGLTGAALDHCCQPNNNMFQRVPSGDVNNVQNVFKKTDRKNLVDRHAKG